MTIGDATDLLPSQSHARPDETAINEINAIAGMLGRLYADTLTNLQSHQLDIGYSFAGLSKKAVYDGENCQVAHNDQHTHKRL